MSDQKSPLDAEPLPAPPVRDQSADQPKKPEPTQPELPYDQEKEMDDPQEAVPDSAVEMDDPEDDVFGGEEDEAARLEIEKNLLTDSDNSPTEEDGDQPDGTTDDT